MAEKIVVQAGCPFETGSGVCGAEVRARGYCAKHYKIMNRRGAFKLRPERPRPEPRPDASSIERARVKLEGYAEDLIDCLVTAAKVAAAKGNSAPAENALIHARVLAPVVAAGPSKGEAGGIRVLVGVQLGTVPAVPGTTPSVPGTRAHIPASLPAMSCQNVDTSRQDFDSQLRVEHRNPGPPDPLPVLTAEVIPA